MIKNGLNTICLWGFVICLFSVSCGVKPVPFSADSPGENGSDSSAAADYKSEPAGSEDDLGTETDTALFDETDKPGSEDTATNPQVDRYVDGSDLKLDLDDSFASGGVFVYPSASGDDAAIDAVATADGSIFVTGKMWNGHDPDLVLMKLTSSGHLDETFQSKGYLTRHSIAGGDNYDSGETIQLAPDGDLLLSGVSDGPGEFRVGFLWKVSTHGVTDGAFGEGGTAILNVNVGYKYFHADYDPRSGNVFVTCPIDGRINAYRVLADGSDLDRSFGSNGNIQVYSSQGIQPVMATLADGTLLVAGSCAGGSPSRDACAWHIGRTGELKTSFTNYDDRALVHENLAGGEGNDSWRVVAPYPSPAGDRVVLAGASQSRNNGQDELVARVKLSDGTLDTTFGGGDGFWTEDVMGLGTNGRVRDVMVKRDGTIVAAMEVISADGDYDVVIVKLDPSGARDMSAASGSGALVLGGEYEERHPQLVELADGRLLVFSSTANEAESDIVVWAVK